MKTLLNNGREDSNGKRLQLVEWFEHGPFAVEVKNRPQTADRLNMERNHYVELVIGIFDHRPPGSFAGLRRNRRNSRLDR